PAPLWLPEIGGIKRPGHVRNGILSWRTASSAVFTQAATLGSSTGSMINPTPVAAVYDRRGQTRTKAGEPGNGSVRFQVANDFRSGPSRLRYDPAVIDLRYSLPELCPFRTSQKRLLKREC